jgi:hypothetical protein
VFKKWFGKEAPPAKPSTPEIMGLRLGGAFELDALRMKLIEPKLVIEKATTTQLIQAVGVVRLDEGTTILRYYTDDDGYLQVLLDGGMTENHIADVKLWYFHDTKGIANDTEWERVLDAEISMPSTTLEGEQYTRVWESVGSASPPVAMTETTYHENGSTSRTDQFAMLYEREIDHDLYEYLSIIGEERLIEDRLDRCMVISTAFDIRQTDIEIIG